MRHSFPLGFQVFCLCCEVLVFSELLVGAQTTLVFPRYPRYSTTGAWRGGAREFVDMFWEEGLTLRCKRMMSESNQSTTRSDDKLKCVDASAVSPCETFPLFEPARRLGLVAPSEKNQDRENG